MTIGIVHMSSNTLGDFTAGPAGLTVSNDLPRGLLLRISQTERFVDFSRRVSHVTETRAFRIWPSLPLRLHVHKTRGYDQPSA